MRLVIFLFSGMVGGSAFAQTANSSGSGEPIKAMNIKVRVVDRAKDTASIFSEKLDDLKKQLAAESDPKKRYGLFAQATSDLSKIASGERPEDEEKALEMAIVMETFADLPTVARYNPANCAKELKTARLKMSNRMAGDPEDPGVTKGLEILKLVCGN